MGEVRFYHLTELPLERVLPQMLERTLARGQRAVVRGSHAERLGWLDRMDMTRVSCRTASTATPTRTATRYG